MDAKEVKECLQARHFSPDWIWSEEFALAPGYMNVLGEGRRIDGLAFSAFPSTGHKIIGYEVKVSRSDFLLEIRNPQKRKVAVDLCDEFYFATPKGLVHPKEIPEDCGLVECSIDGENKKSRLKKKIAKPKIEGYLSPQKMIGRELPKWFMASVCRQFDPQRAREDEARKHWPLITELTHIKEHAVWHWKQTFVV